MKAQLLHEHEGEKTFVLVFAAGDEAIAGLTAFAKEKGLAASHFTAIGGFQEATLGYFDLEKKDYNKLPVREQVEVLSLVGDITLTEKGEPKIHAHVVLGRSDASTRGGHLIEARVRPTLEVMLVESPRHLRRKHDPQSGLALIQL
ncbi:MAG TPA: PPC domain-containing DNA-binding protein [Gemmataceae bacterium]|nr:PPC domain-containing DNA-binding protein [Gemmataceae bacterium]